MWVSDRTGAESTAQAFAAHVPAVCGHLLASLRHPREGLPQPPVRHQNTTARYERLSVLSRVTSNFRRFVLHKGVRLLCAFGWIHEFTHVQVLCANAVTPCITQSCCWRRRRARCWRRWCTRCCCCRRRACVRCCTSCCPSCRTSTGSTAPCPPLRCSSSKSSPRLSRVSLAAAVSTSSCFVQNILRCSEKQFCCLCRWPDHIWCEKSQVFCCWKQKLLF